MKWGWFFGADIVGGWEEGTLGSRWWEESESSKVDGLKKIHSNFSHLRIALVFVPSYCIPQRGIFIG